MNAVKRRVAPAKRAFSQISTLNRADEAGTQEAVRLAQQENLENMARMARRISHALNNMLAVSRGNLALLRDTSRDDREAQDMINDALASLNDAERLSANLAALANHEPFSLKILSLHSWLAEYVQTQQDRLGAHWHIRLDAPEELPMVQVDPRYLELALNALVKNACEALGSGTEGEIRLRVHLEQGARRLLHIMVIDSAGGMRLRGPLRPFEVGGSSRSRHSNIGIGLWYARQIMRACGGDATIAETGLGEGGFVQLTLPCADPR